MAAIKQAAIIGGGIIGAAGFRAADRKRYRCRGITIRRLMRRQKVRCRAEPTAEQAYGKLTNVRSAAAKAASCFGTHPQPRRNGRELIVESVPERLDIKQSVYAEIETARPAMR